MTLFVRSGLVLVFRSSAYWRTILNRGRIYPECKQHDWSLWDSLKYRLVREKYTNFTLVYSTANNEDLIFMSTLTSLEFIAFGLKINQVTYTASHRVRDIRVLYKLLVDSVPRLLKYTP